MTAALRPICPYWPGCAPYLTYRRRRDPPIEDRVDADLTAPHTPTGITNEALTGLVVADALLLALTTLDETRAV